MLAMYLFNLAKVQSHLPAIYLVVRYLECRMFAGNMTIGMSCERAGERHIVNARVVHHWTFSVWMPRLLFVGEYRQDVLFLSNLLPSYRREIVLRDCASVTMKGVDLFDSFIHYSGVWCAPRMVKLTSVFFWDVRCAHTSYVPSTDSILEYCSRRGVNFRYPVELDSGGVELKI